jgi:hypothetical protein
MNVVQKEGKEEGRDNLQGAGGQHSHLGELSASPSRPSSRPPITLEFLFSYNSSCTTSLPDPHFFQKHPCPPTLCNQRLIQAKFRQSIPIRRKLHKKQNQTKFIYQTNKQKTSMQEREGARETRNERALQQYLGNKEAGVNNYTKK